MEMREPGFSVARVDDFPPPTMHSEEELEPFVLTEDDFRNNLSPILEASRHAKKVPGLKSLWRGLLEVVER
jgi:hypothetical protein